MTYNPDLQKWEGNEEALLDFDRATPVRPALITNKGGSKMPHTVGQMVFDPVKMCWIGNEEDVDVFAGVLSEEEMEKMSDMTGGCAVGFSEGMVELLVICDLNPRA